MSFEDLDGKGEESRVAEARRETADIIRRAALSPADKELLDAYLACGDWAEAGIMLQLLPPTLRKRKQRLLSTLRQAAENATS